MKLLRHELGREIRCLMRSLRSATLSTGLATAEGWPYGSMVTVAIDQSAHPLLLLSDLSDHTHNLAEDSRASLLFVQPTRHRNPQRGARVTVLGNIRKTDKSEHAARFLTMHPEAQMYAGFGDFNFYRMSVDRAHWVGGFAQAQWLDGKQVTFKGTQVQTISEAEAGVIDHVNLDHGDTVDLYARKLLGRRGDGWRMVGIDGDGADLERDGRFARLPFPSVISNASEARDILVSLAVEARCK